MAKTTFSAEKRLALSFAITLVILAAEVAGGLLANSIALLSDAGHVATDAFALGLSMIAARISRKPSDFRATFGYQRVGLLAAIMNGVSLVIISVFILAESSLRLMSPPEIRTGLMLPVALGGLIGNIVMAAVLGHGHRDLNIRSAWLHVLGDTLSSIGVLIAGTVVWLTGWSAADPVAGLLIAVIIVIGGVRVVKESLVIFLDLVPRGYDIEEISRTLSSLPEVLGIHDVHLWSLSHRRVAFSAHVWVHDQKLSEAAVIRSRIEEILRTLNISHIMLQFECAECESGGIYCQVHTKEEHNHDH